MRGGQTPPSHLLIANSPIPQFHRPQTEQNPSTTRQAAPVDAGKRGRLGLWLTDDAKATNPRNRYLFEARQRTKYATRRIEQIVAHYAHMADLPKHVHPHLLRHQMLT